MRWAVLCMAVMGWATQAAAASCPCTNVFVGEARPFIAEGIARDAATDRFFVASVATRRIVTIHDGRQRDFAHLPDDYSPLGIALSGGTLWVTASVLPQGSGHDGPSALIALDQRDGQVRQVYPVTDAGRHILNDLTFAPDGTVYASDAMDGSLYRLISPVANEYAATESVARDGHAAALIGRSPLRQRGPGAEDDTELGHDWKGGTDPIARRA